MAGDSDSSFGFSPWRTRACTEYTVLPRNQTKFALVAVPAYSFQRLFFFLFFSQQKVPEGTSALFGVSKCSWSRRAYMQRFEFVCYLVFTAITLASDFYPSSGCSAGTFVSKRARVSTKFGYVCFVRNGILYLPLHDHGKQAKCRVSIARNRRADILQTQVHNILRNKIICSRTFGRTEWYLFPIQSGSYGCAIEKIIYETL